MRATGLRDVDLVADPVFGLDMTDAWRAVLSLHGDDGDDWQDTDIDDVVVAVGRDGERRVDTVGELDNGGVIADSLTSTGRGPRPDS